MTSVRDRRTRADAATRLISAISRCADRQHDVPAIAAPLTELSHRRDRRYVAVSAMTACIRESCSDLRSSCT